MNLGAHINLLSTSKAEEFSHMHPLQQYGSPGSTQNSIRHEHESRFDEFYVPKVKNESLTGWLAARLGI
jgi:hypothetical protein